MRWRGIAQVCARRCKASRRVRRAPRKGFTGSEDVWDRNGDFGLWTLHAWVWKENPNGIFAEFSPRVP
ncbi:MAG TPA: hypothetical protein VNN73_24130 [Blastocatellia bacterium]|nr:hypothetical protein [Blastocatellia bacterium]